MTREEMDDRPPTGFGPQDGRQPMFNVPGIVLATILLLALVHAARVYLLSGAADEQLVLDLAFIPGCYELDCVGAYQRSAGADLWSPLSHALLHGDWTHLVLNTVWLLAFGTPIARRLGAAGYLAFSVAGALAGAGLFFLVNPTLLEPVVGASGVVSALMGGACRFAFGALGRSTAMTVDAPRLSVTEALRDRTILIFILVFFGTNLATASSFGSYLAGGATIAWEAHLGGFAFGFLCFQFFDRRTRR
ncbi:rhomboid family intramembrane serine protease [Aureimonas psammosilenae]|uniref:rhomboid family intramembrane serine protease n=1 Tax=Aureimonas psammosilenae TaxID=2495496 RepID=UPI001F3C9D2A|nr:rhomboid family intramembrane serine protease [Aureimonas psammosilenae]